MKAASPEMESLIHSFFQEELTKIAAHCTPAHQAVKKAVKKAPKSSKSKTAAMGSATKNLLLGGALGLGAGLPVGAYAGYRREQNRLSPQEQAVVRQAMQQAYRQGNIAMYNRLRAMAQKPKKNTK